jgi:hypothetical protein
MESAMTRRRVSLLILAVLLLGVPTTRWALGQAELEPTRLLQAAPQTTDLALDQTEPQPASLALSQPAPQRTRHLQAVFSSTNPGGIVTDVVVDVTDGPDGAEAVIEVSRYRPTCANNGCPQVLLHTFNRVPLAAGALQISGDLDAVTVKGSGPMRQRLLPTVGTVSLDLTWTGVGNLRRDEHEEGERFRRARVSGVLRASTTNFTPQVSVDASIEEW